MNLLTLVQIIEEGFFCTNFDIDFVQTLISIEQGSNTVKIDAMYKPSFGLGWRVGRQPGCRYWDPGRQVLFVGDCRPSCRPERIISSGYWVVNLSRRAGLQEYLSGTCWPSCGPGCQPAGSWTGFGQKCHPDPKGNWQSFCQ